MKRLYLQEQSLLINLDKISDIKADRESIVIHTGMLSERFEETNYANCLLPLSPVEMSEASIFWHNRLNSTKIYHIYVKLSI